MLTKLNGTWYARRVPYKRELGLTMKQIKALCKANNGRLPRCGYEVFVFTGKHNGYVYHVWLQNISGSYCVHQYWM